MTLLELNTESTSPEALLSIFAFNLNHATNKSKGNYPYFLPQVSDSSLLLFKCGQAQPMDGFPRGVCS